MRSKTRCLLFMLAGAFLLISCQPDTPAPLPTKTSPPVQPSPTPTLPPTPAQTATPIPPPMLDLQSIPGVILFSMYPYGEIDTMFVDGSKRIVLDERPRTMEINNDRHAVWLPNGDHISYTIDYFTHAEIWLMDTSGENRQMLVDDAATDSSHSWSPEGKILAYVSAQRKIVLYNLDTQAITQLTDGRFRMEADPDWSPDGTLIAFSAIGDGGNLDIYAIQPDGTNLTRITNHPEDDLHPDWSPDSSKIAFSSNRDGDFIKDIFMIDLSLGTEDDGNVPTQLTFGDTLDIDPDWSPDGTMILFSAHTSGATHATIFIMDSNGQYQTPVTEENTYNSPQWKP